MTAVNQVPRGGGREDVLGGDVPLGPWNPEPIPELQYSSQILKHLCDFPHPQCWFGYYSRLTASKYAWLNIAEGEGQM